MSDLATEYVEMVKNLMSKPNLHGFDQLELNIENVITNPEIDRLVYDSLMPVKKTIAPALLKVENDLNLVHAALGLAGEALEFSLADSDINVEEELGDLLWYTVAVYIHYHLRFEYIEKSAVDVIDSIIHWNNTDKPSAHAMLKQVDTVADLCKKLVFYQQVYLKSGESIKDALSHALFLMLDQLHKLHPLPQLMESNMNKLLKGEKARYKSGTFTPEEAAARADKEGE